MFRHQKLTVEVSSVAHIEQCAVLILASMYNSGLEREGRVDITNGWEG
jgi:hypothetical protein